MQIHVATFLASSLSGIAILCCLLAMSSINDDIRLFWEELDQEMDKFKVYLPFQFFKIAF